MKRSLAIIIIVCLFLQTSPTPAATQTSHQPVNPKASAEARAVLKYLYSIQGTYMLSGQYNYEGDSTERMKWSNKVHELTGKYPALWSSDLGWNEWGVINRHTAIDTAKEQWSNRSLISLSWHMCMPTRSEPCASWDNDIKGDLTDAEWQKLMTSGSSLNKTWLARIDKAAESLKQLRDANVPVLWRPLHEMDGEWFWWGGNPERYKWLWNSMYDRYVNHHQLHNLIWVWGGDRFDLEPYYPGAATVDILARDYYIPYTAERYNNIKNLAQDKLIAIGETGKLPPLDVVKSSQPRWIWFNVWANWLVDENTNDTIRAVYKDPWIITQDEMPDLSTASNTFMLVNRATGKHVRPHNCSDVNNETIALVQVPATYTGDCVQWEQVATDGAWFYLRNRATGNHLRPAGCSASDNESIAIKQVSAGYTGECTQWKHVATSAGYGFLVNRATSKHIRPNRCSAVDDQSIEIRQVPETYTGACTQWALQLP